jgi:hypothetical protein
MVRYGRLYDGFFIGVRDVFSIDDSRRGRGLGRNGVGDWDIFDKGSRRGSRLNVHDGLLGRGVGELFQLMHLLIGFQNSSGICQILLRDPFVTGSGVSFPGD